MDIKLNLTQQDIVVLMQALGELPLKVAGPTFAKIQQQLQQTSPGDSPQESENGK